MAAFGTITIQSRVAVDGQPVIPVLDGDEVRYIEANAATSTHQLLAALDALARFPRVACDAGETLHPAIVESQAKIVAEICRRARATRDSRILRVRRRPATPNVEPAAPSSTHGKAIPQQSDVAPAR